MANQLRCARCFNKTESRIQAAWLQHVDSNEDRKKFRYAESRSRTFCKDCAPLVWAAVEAELIKWADR